MKLHQLKIESKYYEEVVKGNKPFELRKDDRGYEFGDLIQFLVHQDKIDNAYLITDDFYEVTYILRNVPEYGLQDGFCILGIKKVEVSKSEIN